MKDFRFGMTNSINKHYLTYKYNTNFNLFKSLIAFVKPNMSERFILYDPCYFLLFNILAWALNPMRIKPRLTWCMFQASWEWNVCADGFVGHGSRQKLNFNQFSIVHIYFSVKYLLEESLMYNLHVHSFYISKIYIIYFVFFL